MSFLDRRIEFRSSAVENTKSACVSLETKVKSLLAEVKSCEKAEEKVTSAYAMARLARNSFVAAYAADIESASKAVVKFE